MQRRLGGIALVVVASVSAGLAGCVRDTDAVVDGFDYVAVIDVHGYEWVHRSSSDYPWGPDVRDISTEMTSLTVCDLRDTDGKCVAEHPELHTTYSFERQEDIVQDTCQLERRWTEYAAKVPRRPPCEPGPGQWTTARNERHVRVRVGTKTCDQIVSEEDFGRARRVVKVSIGRGCTIDHLIFADT